MHCRLSAWTDVCVLCRECEAGLGKDVVNSALSSLDLLDPENDPVSGNPLPQQTSHLLSAGHEAAPTTARLQST